MNQLVKLLGLTALVAAATVNLSCGVNEYCLNCATGDGGHGDGMTDADDGGVDDATDAGECVPSNNGVEICDGKDNDCNGSTDDGTLPQVGQDCANQMGECSGGKITCVDGALSCSKLPRPEECNLKDDDCDGDVDDGDPGGGAVCGTNTGECVAGANRCIDGHIECVGAIGTVGGQAEECNNRDDDCDGKFDEGVTLGPCVAGDDGPAEGNTGECNLGQRQCIGGTIVCSGAVFPTFEQCDGLDQDCDGNNANGYNTSGDPQNCGACGAVCDLPNAFEGCASGMCTVVACQPNFFDNDHQPGNGCEFNCGHPYLGNEVCNGIDDDCDGLVDAADPDLAMNAPTAMDVCAQQGACATGTTLTCDGGAGWVCHYSNPNVETDVDGNIVAETRCDSDIVAGTQADNDCDGQIDEAQAAELGDACDNGGVGDCRATGVYVCNTENRSGPAACNNAAPAGMSAETCDGKDNDCNGVVDDGAADGSIATGQDWVTIPGSSTKIMKYEASHPDATSSDGGTLETHVCSRAGTLPWTNVTHPQAEAACAEVGARLCTESEWEAMCAPAQAAPTYPLAGPPAAVGGGAAADFVLVEAEQAFANVTVGGKTFTATTSRPGFSGASALQALPNSGTSVSLANAAANAARASFSFTGLSTSTSYYVWVRMLKPSPYSASNLNNVVHVGIGTAQTSAPTQTLTIPTLTPAASDPTLDKWVWVRSGAITPGAAAAFVNVFMGEDGVVVDAVALTRDASGTPPPVSDAIWAYPTNVKFPQPTACNDDEYDTSPTVMLTSSTQAGTVATFTTQTAHGLLVGQQAAIAGVSVSGYNGTWNVSSVISSTKFTAVLPVSGLSAGTGGTVNAGDQDYVLPTGSLSTCYADGPDANDAYDMSGNVKEWTEERSAGVNPIRGGASNNEVGGLSCTLDFTTADDAFYFPNVGFRCCK